MLNALHVERVVKRECIVCNRSSFAIRSAREEERRGGKRRKEEEREGKRREEEGRRGKSEITSTLGLIQFRRKTGEDSKGGEENLEGKRREEEERGGERREEEGKSYHAIGYYDGVESSE